MFKRTSLFLAVIVFTVLCGCVSTRGNQAAVAKPELLREFVPPGDAKITENGEAPILDAGGGLPAKATVLLAEVHDPKMKEGVITHFIAVCPEGLHPVWLGREDIGEEDYGQNRKSQKGLSTNFNMEESDGDQGSRLCWLSSKPALLLITGVEYGAGIRLWSERHDFLVLYEDGAPKVLLHETWSSSVHWGDYAVYESRKVANRITARGIEMTFVDSRTEDDAAHGDSASPLRRQFGWSPVPSEDPPECWYGIIETKRTRTWVFADGALALESDRLEYKVQPGDTWEDIALGFFKDAKFVQAIRDMNPESGRLAEPLKDSWIVLPKGASRYP